MQKAFFSSLSVVCALHALTLLNLPCAMAQGNSVPPPLLPLPAGSVVAENTAPAPAVPSASHAAETASTLAAPTSVVPASSASVLAVNILVVPMELGENAAPAGAAPATIDGIAPAGPSQSAAAALRRALVRRGWNDVLTAPPDSGVVRRLLAEEKIAVASLTATQNALRQLETNHKATLPANASTQVTAPITPVETTLAANASTEKTTEKPLDIALREAVRLGRALNYRAVVLLGMKRTSSATANEGEATTRANYVVVLADTLRETGQGRVLEASGATPIALHEAAAGSALLFLEGEFASWPNPNAADRDQKITEFLQSARENLSAGKMDAARSLVNQALALDSGRAEIYLVLGDILLGSNAAEAADTYRKAVGKTGANEGEIWARVTSAHVKAQEWPRALEAGKRALDVGYDSAALRSSIAAAQFGRAILFRNAGQYDNADAADAEANKQLERAKTLSPDDPIIARTQAGYLVAQTEYLQAVQVLDSVAPKFPADIEMQNLYATALTQRPNRGEEAFAAWSRVWHARQAASATFTATPFRRLTQGYDEWVSNLAREAANLSQSVANGASSREEALPKMQELIGDMARAQYGIKILQAPNKTETRRLSYRIFAADLLVQTLDLQRAFLETGDKSYIDRAGDLHRQAILQINTARVS